MDSVPIAGEAYTLLHPCLSSTLPSVLCLPMPLTASTKNNYELQCADPFHNAAVPKTAKGIWECTHVKPDSGAKQILKTQLLKTLADASAFSCLVLRENRMMYRVSLDDLG